MLFNSFEFLVFFPVVVALYFALPTVRHRQWLLVVASTVFYMAFIPAYAVILYSTIVIDYLAGLKIEASEGRERKLWLAASIVANVGCLAVFKYFNFAVDNLNALFGVAGLAARVPLLKITLPVGLSFHTFQAMSYTIEVYRGGQRAERSFLVYALYVMFFPQLVAGPIERPQNIIHQLTVLHRFDASRAAHGLRLMLWGFFKKVVIADRLAILVNTVYGAPSHFSGPILAFATVAFAVQIYADFSGYSDIALGSAEVLGVKLMTNFRQPYVSESVSEFWSRWHISLSSWFRDYLYIPLGGNRVSPLRRKINLLTTFLVSGLWHGANWTYVAWGGLNGLFLVAEGELLAKRKQTTSGLLRLLRVCLTFVLICATWVFFRAATIHDALVVFRRLPVGLASLARPGAMLAQLGQLAVSPSRLAMTCAAVVVLFWVDAIAARKATHPADLIAGLPKPPRWGVYFGLSTALVLMGIYGRQQFIYFQF